jgi:thiaminase (transcriptional activator TenA)
MTFANQLWDANQSQAQACLNNAFVQGIGDGSLPQAKFAYYVGQDAFFLDAFARAYSICAAKAPGTQAFGVFHGLAGGALEELKLHGGYAQDWGLDLSQVSPGVTTRRYVDFLVATAWSQCIGVTAAAMAPCMRLYAYLGQQLAQGGVPDHAYSDWIKTYSEAAFEDLADQLEALLEQYGQVNETVSQAAQRAYTYAMQCELDFFQAAWEVGA